VLNLITNQNVINHSGDTRLSYNQLAHIQTNNWWIEPSVLPTFLFTQICVTLWKKRFIAWSIL